MKYKSNKGFTHGQPDKIGVLVTNLGTPEAPTKQALRPYLKEFFLTRRLWNCLKRFGGFIKWHYSKLSPQALGRGLFHRIDRRRLSTYGYY